MTLLRAVLLTLALWIVAPRAFACTTCAAALQSGVSEDLCPGSATRYDALVQCLCTDLCADVCASNACQSLPFDDACQQCMDGSCVDQLGACTDDVSGCDVGAVDCGNNTCCAAPSEACLPDGTCLLPCPEGQYRCGADRCAQDGFDCCADLGFPEITCGPPHVCGENGDCVLNPLASSCEGGCATSTPAAAVLPALLLLGLALSARPRAA